MYHIVVGCFGYKKVCSVGCCSRVVFVGCWVLWWSFWFCKFVHRVCFCSLMYMLWFVYSLGIFGWYMIVVCRSFLFLLVRCWCDSWLGIDCCCCSWWCSWLICCSCFFWSLGSWFVFGYKMCIYRVWCCWFCFGWCRFGMIVWYRFCVWYIGFGRWWCFWWCRCRCWFCFWDW